MTVVSNRSPGSRERTGRTEAVERPSMRTVADVSDEPTSVTPNNQRENSFVEQFKFVEQFVEQFSPCPNKTRDPGIPIINLNLQVL